MSVLIRNREEARREGNNPQIDETAKKQYEARGIIPKLMRLAWKFHLL